MYMKEWKKIDLKYGILLYVIIIVLNGCAGMQHHNGNIANLPKKCGKYEIDYGMPSALVANDDISSIQGIMIHDKRLNNMDVKYVGKKVAVFSWVQTVGGLPMPDGSGGDSVTYYNVVKVIPLVEKDNFLNREAIEKACNELKVN